MHTPDFLPVLSRGAHTSPKDGACAMEYVSFLAGEEWSDRPACVHPVIASMARSVNDSLGDDERQALLPLLARTMGTAPTGTDEERRRLSVALAVWCAEEVAHLARAAEPWAREAIRVARAWLDGKAGAEECREIYAAGSYITDADAFAATAAAFAAARAVYVTYVTDAGARAGVAAAYAAEAVDCADLPGLLSGLLDEYDRLTGRTERPALTDDDLRRLAALTA